MKNILSSSDLNSTSRNYNILTCLFAALGFISFLFHALFPTDGSLELQWVGFIIISLSLLLAVLSVTKKELKNSCKDFFKEFKLPALLILIIFTLVGISQITTFPTWNEEAGWLDIGKAIANAELIHPIRAKSDFPSAFQGWPIGGLMAFGVDAIVASRSVSIFYILLYLYFFGLVLNRVTSSQAVSWFLLALVALSKSYVLVGMSGWHEVTPIFFLVTAQWYYFIRMWHSPTSKEKTFFAILAGISIWSIYVPMLMTLSFGLLLLPKLSHVLKKENIRALIICFLIAAPLLGQIIYTKGMIFDRHLSFYVDGGEWENSRVHSLQARIEKIQQSAIFTFESFMPNSKAKIIDDYASPHIEWTLLLLATIGIFNCLFILPRKYIYLLLAPTIFLLCGLVLSTPNEYRLTSLIIPTHIFAALGMVLILSIPWISKRPLIKAILSCSILIAQYQQVLKVLPDYIEMFRTICPEALLAKGAIATIDSLNPYPKIIMGGGGATGRLINATLRHQTKLKEIRSHKELIEELEKNGQVPFILVFGEGNDEQSEDSLKYAMENGYRKIASLQSALNKISSVVILIKQN